MKKLKALYYSAVKSVTSIDYYREILETKISFSYKYFLGLSLVLSFILCIRFAIVEVPAIVADLKQTGNLVKDMFENDLVVEIKDGTWSINKQEPYAINITTDTLSKSGFGDHKHFIIFAHEGTIDKFDEYDTYLLINSKNVVGKENGGFKATPISEFNLPQGKITKADFDGFIDGLMKYIKWIPVLTTIMAFIGVLFYFIFIVGTNMFVISAPIWFFGQVAGFKSDGTKFTVSKIKYFDCVKISIHAATLPLILFTITRIINYEGLSKVASFWQEILTLILAAFIVWMLSRDKKGHVAGKNAAVVTPIIGSGDKDVTDDTTKETSNDPTKN